MNRQMGMKSFLQGLILVTLSLFAGFTQAAGLLTPGDGSLPVLEIRDHQVNVVIEDGYAITTDPGLDPSLNFTPIVDFDLDNPALDGFDPDGVPLDECCGDCVQQAGENCDDGNANGGGDDTNQGVNHGAIESVKGIRISI